MVDAIFRAMGIDAPAASAPGAFALLLVVPLTVLLSLASISGLGRVRHTTALVVRCLLIVCLILALAQTECIRTTYDQTVMFLVDQSVSVPREQLKSAGEFVRAAQAGIRAGKDRVGLIRFDGEPSIEQLPAEQLQEEIPGRPVKPHETNIADAVRLAMAVLPAETAKRIVVLSDGNENVRRAIDEAGVCEATGVAIDVVPLQYEHSSEVIAEKLVCPPTAAKDETVRLSLVLRSQGSARGKIRLYQDDVAMPIGTDGGEAMAVNLDAGVNRFDWQLPVRDAGARRFRAVFVPDDAASDSIAANNEARAYTLVGGPDRTLIVANPDEMASADAFARALESQGIASDVREVGTIRLDGVSLLPYPLVVLQNIPAYALSQDELAGIAAFTRDQGGGLIAIGGDKAFSVGGYYQTPLEDVLPVGTNRDPKRMLLMRTALVLVIDCSGSMTGQKLFLAQKAAMASADLLSSQDELGIVMFQDAAEWVLKLGRRPEKGVVRSRIHSLGAGGGTDLYPGLYAAYQALIHSQAAARHVIVLTDGQTAPADFPYLAKRMGSMGMTVTTVAVGPDADKQLLSQIAKLSGGRFYTTDDPMKLPQIFARETVVAGRSNMSEERFVPILRPNARELLGAVKQSEVPPLEGYVVTTPKPGADVSVIRTAGEYSDPILATWQVGLGRSAAFTSGMWTRWGADWLRWRQFSKIWSQIVRWASRPEDARGFDVRTELDGGVATIRIEAHDDRSSPIEFLTFNGRVSDPKSGARPLPVTQTGPGTYEAKFETSDPGSYVVGLAYEGARRDGERISGVLRTGVSVAYSRELRSVRSDDAMLSALAQKTGGRVLEMHDAASVFDPSVVRPLRSHRPIWPTLLKIAVVLFLVDVAVRRASIDGAKMAAAVRGYLGDLAGRRTAAGAEVVLQDLKGLRERIKVEKTAAGEHVRRPHVYAHAPKASHAGAALERAGGEILEGFGNASEAPNESTLKPDDSAEKQNATTARLLNSRKRRQEGT